MNDDSDQLAMLVKKTLITTYDFPKKNFIYRGIVDLLLKSDIYHQCIDRMGSFIRKTGANTILSPELSGCLFAAPLAYQTGCRFVIARKPGKLPNKVYSIHYANEYFEQTLQIHRNSLLKSDRVFLIDDVISTGGTLFALCDLVKKTGANVVGAGFLFETVLASQRKWKSIFPIFSILQYSE